MGFLNTVTRLSFDLYEGKMHFRFVLFIWYFTKQANDGNKNSIFCKICQHYCNNSELWIVHRQFTICSSFLSFISTADEITHGSESHLSGSRKWCVSLTVVYCVNPSGQQQTFQFVLRDLQSWHFEYRNVKNAPLNTIKRFSTLLQKYNFWHEKIHSQFKYF